MTWDDAISKINEYASRPADELNDDGFDGDWLMPPTAESLTAARREAETSRGRSDEPPLRVCLDGEGGIQFDWRRPGRIACVVFGPDGTASSNAYVGSPYASETAEKFDAVASPNKL